LKHGTTRAIRTALRLSKNEMGWVSPDGGYYRVAPSYRTGGGGHEFLARDIAVEFKYSGSNVLEKLGWIRVDVKDAAIRCCHFCGESCITQKQKDMLEKMRTREPDSDKKRYYTTFLGNATVRTSDCDPRKSKQGFLAYSPATGVVHWVYE
jgi:hypothetical protein